MGLTTISRILDLRDCHGIEPQNHGTDQAENYCPEAGRRWFSLAIKLLEASGLYTVSNGCQMLRVELFYTPRTAETIHFVISR